MARNTNNFPYFTITATPEERETARFLRHKFLPRLRRQIPQHYLVQPIPRKRLAFITETARTYPYFLRFDVASYYPSISHERLLSVIPEAWRQLTGAQPSRRLSRTVTKDLPRFLDRAPYGQGLPIGHPLTHILAGIYLLPLDLAFDRPFLRYVDDYLVFCRTEKEAEDILREIVMPHTESLGLELNTGKLASGRFHTDPVSFTGFVFYAGHFAIQTEKRAAFRARITQITALTKHKPAPAVIKQLNNQIQGFGHYYKLASCAAEFEELDAFVRKRLRRYLLRQKHVRAEESNLLLTNEGLQQQGLKSLADIKRQYEAKRKRKPRQKREKSRKTGSSHRRADWAQLEETAHQYKLARIAEQLDELTSSVKRLETKLNRIEKKVEQQNRQPRRGLWAIVRRWLK